MPGGIGNHAYCLAKELDSLGFVVAVVTECREGREGSWNKFVADNPKLRIVGVPRRRPILITYLARFWRVLKELRRAKDCVAIFSGKFPVWICGLLPVRNSVAVIHGTEIRQSGLSRRLFERGLQKVTAIVCVSEFTKRRLIAEYGGLDGLKVSVINNGFASDWSNGNRPKTSAPAETLRLVTVGGIHKRKGQFNVVRALPEIASRFPGLRYDIVGIPAEKEELLDLIESREQQDNVYFHHGLSDAEVKEILHASDIFLMLSENLENGDFEGFGIAILEAMAIGVPAIGSRDSGIADAISDGTSGFLVDPHNPDEVLSAVERIVEEYPTFSANAVGWAGEFRWTKKIKEYEELLNGL